MELAGRLKEMRLTEKLSQKAMADELRVALSTYQYYERGEREIPSDFIVRLVKRFNVNPMWLFDGSGEMLKAPSGLSLRIMTIRDTFKLSVVEMAMKIDVDPETLNDYEEGINDPDEETINVIIDRFDISPAWILFGEGEMKKSPRDHMRRRATPIIERLKAALKLKNDEQLEDELQVQRGKIVSMITRYNEIPYDQIATLCDKRGLSFDWILTGEGKMLRAKPSPIDLDLLIEVKKAVKKTVRKNKLQLSEKEEAAIEAILYEELLEDPTKKTKLNERVLRIARVVA
jgi:transcriptional regulator with XRE-family HTH domain